jgi:hypothetical protein
LKSCQDVNCALPVSSPITPEKTFFVYPTPVVSLSLICKILAVMSTLPTPECKSLTFNSLGLKASSGSLSLSVFSTFTN